MILATENEIRNAIPFISLQWEIQNDKADKETRFIYYCQRIDQVISLANSNDVNVNFAIHRWFNFQTSKKIENILCDFGAVPYENEYDHDVDLSINDITFDVKTSVISKKYTGDTNLNNLYAKKEYMNWLIKNASKESRHHTKRKLFFVFDKLEDKANFKEITSTIGKFIGYFNDNTDKYYDENSCELIYCKTIGG